MYFIILITAFWQFLLGFPFANPLLNFAGKPQIFFLVFRKIAKDDAYVVYDFIDFCTFMLVISIIREGLMNHQ